MTDLATRLADDLRRAGYTDAERTLILDALARHVSVKHMFATMPIAMAPYHLARMDNLWAFAGTDASGEGICGLPLGDTMVPMIASDRSRLESLTPYAIEMAKRGGRRITLIRFERREELTTFEP